MMITSFSSVSRDLPKIFDQFSSAEGFLFLQDNTILNYWNLLQSDKTKLWITNEVFRFVINAYLIILITLVDDVFPVLADF